MTGEWIYGKLVLLDFGFPMVKSKNLNRQFSGPFGNVLINPFLKFARINASILTLKGFGSGCFNQSHCDGLFESLATGKADFTLEYISPFNVNQSYIEETNMTGIEYGSTADDRSVGFGQMNRTTGFVTELTFGLAPIDFKVFILLVCLVSFALFGRTIHYFLKESKFMKDYKPWKDPVMNRKRKIYWFKALDPFCIQRIQILKFWLVLLVFLIHQFMVGLTKSDLVVWVPPSYFNSLNEALDAQIKTVTLTQLIDVAEIKIAAEGTEEKEKLLENLKEVNFMELIRKMSRGAIFLGKELTVNFIRSMHCAMAKMKMPKGQSSKGKTRRWIKADPSSIRFTNWKRLTVLSAFSKAIKGTLLQKRLLKVTSRMFESGYNQKTAELLILQHPFVPFETMYNCLLLKSYKSYMRSDQVYTKAPNQLRKWTIILLVLSPLCLFCPIASLLKEFFIVRDRLEQQRKSRLKRKVAPPLPWRAAYF